MKKIRDAKEFKRSYLSSISAKFNPDLLIGQAFEQDELESKTLDLSSLQLILKNKRPHQGRLSTAQFVRGNEYFSRNHEKTKQEDKPQKEGICSSEEENIDYVNDKNKKSDDEESINNLNRDGDDEANEDDTFNNMKKLKGQRYWAEDNPTIKCHNCK